MSKFIFLSAFITMLILIGFQSCNESNALNKQGKELPETGCENIKTLPVLFHQNAAEYRALCYQAFNSARIMLDQDLRRAGLSKQQAIVVDVDETVLDNSPYEASCIQQGVHYPALWNEWVEKKSAGPVPGALDFLLYAKEKGIEIFYVTNRKEELRQPTLENLKSLGFPNASTGFLLMRTEISSKKARRSVVSENHRIIMFIGDNLNDFSEVFEKKSVSERFELTDQMKSDFGSRFIVLPDMMYGEWEGALYDYDYSKKEAEKSDMRNKKLIGF